MGQQTTSLVCPAHTTKYIGAVILGIIVGMGALFVYFNQTSEENICLNQISEENTYQAGWNAAMERVERSAIGGTFHVPDDIRSLSGTVTAVSGNRITIHTQLSDPFEDPALDDRIVTVATDTKILKFSPKDPKVFQAEMEAFSKTIPSETGLSTTSIGQTSNGVPQNTVPPEPFTRDPADVASIVIGNTLDITATENIKNAKEFLASEIQIQ